MDMEMEDDLFASDKESDDGRRSGAAGEEGDDREKDNDESKKEDDKRKIKPKREGPPRRVLLSEDMVCGKNGLLKLQELFKDFKLQGRGHELHDINAILFKLERWIHILDPKYQFSQTLERIEFLGSKKRTIKTYLKKIRLGMLSNNEEFPLENMPGFNISDNEMEAEFPAEIPEIAGDFPSASGGDDPFGDDLDDNDDWMVAALDNFEKREEEVSPGATADHEINIMSPLKAKQARNTYGSDSEDNEGVGPSQNKRKKTARIASDSDSGSDMEPLLLKTKESTTAARKSAMDSDSEDGEKQVKKNPKKSRLMKFGSDSDSDGADLQPKNAGKGNGIPGDTGENSDDEDNNESSVAATNTNAFDSDSDADNERIQVVKQSNTIDSDSDGEIASFPENVHPSNVVPEKEMNSDSDSENAVTPVKDSTAKFVDSDSDND
jgi:hypothetical protein